MWRLRIRWRVIFEPWCWVRGHPVVAVHGLHASDPSGQLCRRCAKEWLITYKWHNPDGSFVSPDADGVTRPIVITPHPRKVQR